MAKYENSSHIQSAEAIVQIIKSVQVLLEDAGVPLELRLFHNGEPLDIKEMPPHSANKQSDAICPKSAVARIDGKIICIEDGEDCTGIIGACGDGK